jgi:hypothetical protein
MMDQRLQNIQDFSEYCFRKQAFIEPEKRPALTGNSFSI